MDVVIDLGSGWMKAGPAEKDEPTVVEAAVVGRPRSGGVMVGMTGRDRWAGDEAMAKRQILSLEYANEHGIVTNFENAGLLWKHAFAQLEADPAQCRVLVAQSPDVPARLLIARFGAAAAR
ncbi:hypothetical protein ACGFMM_32440 [Streptomyces sp. NPDC048604]|uniref:hypothetical protein n=1 Tax=Streptomyces sp. NPDC048604 TaxID=3365578 RepID=UPI003717DD39